MFCRNCGKQLEDGFKVCPYCGEPVSLAESDARRAAQEQSAAEDTQPVHNDILKEPAPLPAPAPVQPKANKKPEQESESTGGWKVLGFFLGFFGPLLWFLPLVSLVLYLIWKSDKPKVANGIGQFTLIGLAVGVGAHAEKPRLFFHAAKRAGRRPGHQPRADGPFQNGVCR